MAQFLFVLHFLLVDLLLENFLLLLNELDVLDQFVGLEFLLRIDDGLLLCFLLLEVHKISVAGRSIVRRLWLVILGIFRVKTKLVVP